MAQWKETLEPYVKVTETVKSSTLTPTAGEDLIVGAVIMSDSGPATPTLVRNQSEFLKTFSTSEITEEYMKSLDNLYISDKGSNVASTMWLNAYRLAGSTQLLVCRATKGEGILSARPLDLKDSHEYILRDTEILRRVPKFRIWIDQTSVGDDGWILSVSEVGTLGNRVTDEGPQYDYDIYDLGELVDKLNETNKFFSPKYSFWVSIKEGTSTVKWARTDDPEIAEMVQFEEVYLAPDFVCFDDPRTDTTVNGSPANTGSVGLVFSEAGETDDNSQVSETTDQTYILSSEPFAGFDVPKYYVTNNYNSNTDLKVRIRRFNHNAVRNKVLSENEVKKGVSPWVVLTSVLDTYNSILLGENTSQTQKDKILQYDFYEFAILDPSVSEDWQIFNVGNIVGRGDTDTATLNNSLGMMQLYLPDNLEDLNLNYYDYLEDDGILDNHTSHFKEVYSTFKGDTLTANAAGHLLKSTGDALKPEEAFEVLLQGEHKDLVAENEVSKVVYETEEKVLSDFHENGRPDSDKIYILGNMGTQTELLPYHTNSDNLPEITIQQVGEDGVIGEEVTEGIISKAFHLVISVSNDYSTTEVTSPIEDSITVTQHVNENDNGGIEMNPEVTSETSLTYSGITEDSEFIKITIGEKVFYLYFNEDLKNKYTQHRGYTYVGGFVLDIIYYRVNGNTEISTNAKIDVKKSSLLEVSSGDLKKAWDSLEDDERYVVEGFCDLGCTYPEIQNYIANIAINSNYFYPVSLVNSTNYMALANFKKKITKTSHKLYYLAPWDYDNGTTGFTFGVSPAVLYWEVISANRRNNQEFAAAFGEEQAIVNPMNLAKEFKKTERQLLLTRRINTIFHDLYSDRYYINDNWTAQETDDVMKEEMNARLQIRISKALPLLLKQFKGRQNNELTRKDVVYVLNYWFNNTVMTYGSTIAGYLVTCDSSNNTDEDVAANRLNVKVQAKFYNSIKYIEVASISLPLSIDFE